MTPNSDSLRRLERVARNIAAGFSLTVGVLLIVSLIGVTYHNDKKVTAFRAQLAAGRLSDFAYINGATWEYNGHRVPELLAGLDPTGETHQMVFNIAGQVIGATGPEIGALYTEESAPIRNGPKVLGRVTVTSDLGHLYGLAFLSALLGTLLGTATYAFFRLVPLRILSRTLESLRQTEVDLVRQVEATQMALDDAGTERRRAEEASKAKTDFVSNMSHEFRTPLNAIIGFSDILRDEMFGPLIPRYKSYADDINRSGRHLATIVNDVLDIAKMEAKKFDLDLQSTNPIGLIDDCIRLLSNVAERAGITLVRTVGPGLPAEIVVDGTKIKQVVLNILSNALKFSTRGSRVEIAVHLLDDEHITFSVSDSGSGMSESEIDIAFQVFGQNPKPRAPLNEWVRGTGLGLPIALELTKLHGGSLSLESQPGRGTVATLVLPINCTATELPASTGPEPEVY
jgi:signal transduction histidine kinase